MQKNFSNALRLIAATYGLFLLSACAETALPVATPMQLGAAAYAPQGYIRFCERRPDQCGLSSPMAQSDRIRLDKVLNQQQWANVFNLQPTSIEAKTPEVVAATQNEIASTLPAPTPFYPQVGGEPQPGVTGTSEKMDVSHVLPFPTPGKATLHLTPMVWAALNGINQSVNARIHPMSDEDAFGVADYWTLPLSDGPRPVGNCKDYALEKRKALVEAGFSADALSLAIVRTGWGEVHAVLVVDTDKGDYVLDNLSPWIKGWQEVRYSWIERQMPGQPLRWAALVKPESANYRNS